MGILFFIAMAFPTFLTGKLLVRALRELDEAETDRDKYKQLLEFGTEGILERVEQQELIEELHQELIDLKEEHEKLQHQNKDQSKQIKMLKEKREILIKGWQKAVGEWDKAKRELERLREEYPSTFSEELQSLGEELKSLFRFKDPRKELFRIGEYLPPVVGGDMRNHISDEFHNQIKAEKILQEIDHLKAKNKYLEVVLDNYKKAAFELSKEKEKLQKESERYSKGVEVVEEELVNLYGEVVEKRVVYLREDAES